jgi:hypothetical protein
MATLVLNSFWYFYKEAREEEGPIAPRSTRTWSGRLLTQDLSPAAGFLDPKSQSPLTLGDILPHPLLMKS